MWKTGGQVDESGSHSFESRASLCNLARDHQASYGEKFREAENCLGTREEALSAPQSPWQNAYVERLIRSIRR